MIHELMSSLRATRGVCLSRLEFRCQQDTVWYQYVQSNADEDTSGVFM